MDLWSGKTLITRTDAKDDLAIGEACLNGEGIRSKLEVRSTSGTSFCLRTIRV